MVQSLIQKKISVISNPLGGYNRRAGLNKIDLLAEEHGISHIKVSTPNEIENALSAIVTEEPDILVINGGDGTVDEVLRQIRTQNTFKKEPVFALLKGGTTNMIHRDSKLNGKPDKILDQIIHGKITNTITRQPLKVKNSNSNINPLYGFFLGTGAIPSATLAARKNLHKKGLHGPFSEFIILVSSISRLFFKRDLSNDKILNPTYLSLNDQRQNHIFLALTTLKNLIPFIKSPATLTHAGAIYMDNSRKLQRTLHDKITLKTQENWVLDGEMQEAGNIEITLDTPVRFLTKGQAR